MYKHTNIVKLRNFQYRLLLNKVFTNATLCEWKVIDSPQCSFCGKNAETILHLLWGCEIVHNMWEKLKVWLQDHGLNITFTASDIIFNRLEGPKIIGSLVVMLKHYIYVKRCKKENICENDLFYLINDQFAIEKYNAKVDNKYKAHVEKWKHIYPEITETILETTALNPV